MAIDFDSDPDFDLDGPNKTLTRLGKSHALVFLAENGVSFHVSEAALYETVMAVAAGTMSQTQLIDWCREQL